MLLLLVLALLNFVAAKVPQVLLCESEGCPSVSRIGLGTLHLGDKIGGLSDATKVNEWVRTAVGLGITLFDTADVYPVKGGTAGDSAKLLGEALQQTPGLREKITIVAKMGILFPNKNQTFAAIDTSSDHILNTVNWFLSSLQTTYLDIILIHYPNSFMNIKELSSLFNTLKQSGKVKQFGVSNHYTSHINILQNELNKYNIKLITNEIEISVWNLRYLNYNSDSVDHAIINGYRNLAWGALAGDSTGGLNRLFQRKGDRQTKILDALNAVGEELGESDPAVVALAWTLSHPAGIVPLIGTTKINRVKSYVAAVDLASKITTTQWWKIGGAGGLCAMADDQCDYADYRP